FILPDPPSMAVGVGSIPIGSGRLCPATFIFSPCVCTVGNNPDSIPPVGSADTASRYNVRPDFVSCRLQVRAHSVEYQSVRPINKAVNVFPNDPSRSNSPNDTEHRGPKVAGVFRTLAFAR